MRDFEREKSAFVLIRHLDERDVLVLLFVMGPRDGFEREIRRDVDVMFMIYLKMGCGLHFRFSMMEYEVSFAAFSQDKR
eukprot:CAMPEP_0201202942 /NCGR_PEP_ID=MMETSP0851-20130426/166055_1 /ASSEMBLY_ACC=CAM_ASM_000631 /TAXON_ID=183588 /ORGANISM="Pseudo-nitzschia fraudulenta, Strain WWA7" /LENGTH=78 /DNA_ID=CAMNT_0047490855 /DNA_START=146 /DNA_END=379 /DNA_ORIENTATION=-